MFTVLTVGMILSGAVVVSSVAYATVLFVQLITG